MIITGWARAYCLRATEAREATQAQGLDEGRQVRRDKARGVCGPIGFGPQFIAEPWLRKCIGRFEERGYSENQRHLKQKRLC